MIIILDNESNVKFIEKIGKTFIRFILEGIMEWSRWFPENLKLN
jgi:hypothetical protein